MSKCLFLILFLVCLTVQLQGQDTPVTDRPTVTFSPRTLPKSYFQIETGFQYKINDAQLIGNIAPGLKIDEILFNTLLLRYGLVENFELRLNNNISQTRFRLNGESTFEDDVAYLPTTIGFKWRMLTEHAKWPDIALLAHYGGNVFSSIESGAQADVALLFNSPLFKSFNLDYNIGLLLEDDLRSTIITYSAVASRSINYRISAFFELYGSREESMDPLANFNVGLTYLLSNTWQIDAYGGSGLSKESPNYLFGFGIGKLFLPNK